MKKRSILLSIFIFTIVIFSSFTTAENLFEVTSTRVSEPIDQGSANIGYENLQNWPNDAYNQCKEAHDRVLEKCKNSGYENYFLIRQISGSDAKLYQEKLYGSSDYQTIQKEMQNSKPNDTDKLNQAFKEASAEPTAVTLTYRDYIYNDKKCEPPTEAFTSVYTPSETVTLMKSTSEFSKETGTTVTASKQYSC